MTGPSSENRKTRPKKRFLKQPMMIHVCYALIPCLLGSIYFFGLRALALTALVLVLGIVTEALFTLRQGKPVTSAVLVTSLIYTLSLPPTTPFWIAAVGIIFGVVFGKMVFGGFGFNAFNPAMVGRCFIYIAFPTVMTNRWVEPFDGAVGGFSKWSSSIDAVSQATPLPVLAEGSVVSLERLFFGSISGSLGETAGWLIIAGGIYIIYKKFAPWRLAVSCLMGGVITASVFWGLGDGAADPFRLLTAGSFLFGAFFVVTEPVSGPKTPLAQWVYGFLIGALTMILRKYSSFPEGMMFAVLFMNTFAPVMDIGVKEWKGRGKKT